MQKKFANKEKKKMIKKNKLTKKIIIIGIIFVILICLVVFIIISKNRPQVPQEDVLYSAEYQGTPVLFYKYANMITAPGNPIGPTFGMYVPYDKATSPQMINSVMMAEYIDFQKLQNPQKLFTFDRYISVENIQLSSDKTYMILSLIGGPNDLINYIYQVNLKTSQSKQIWQHEERTGNSPFNRGEAYITQFVPERYVVFDIIAANPPPSEVPAGTVVLNMQTGSEKSLGTAGGVQINLNSNTVSYKTISRVEVPCEKPKDPACFVGDTYKYAYEPTGPVHTQTLP